MINMMRSLTLSDTCFSTGGVSLSSESDMVLLNFQNGGKAHPVD